MTVGEAEASKWKTLSKLLCLLLVPQVGWFIFPPCNHRHFVIAAEEFWWDCLAQMGWDYLQAEGGYSRGGHLSVFPFVEFSCAGLLFWSDGHKSIIKRQKYLHLRPEDDHRTSKSWGTLMQVF